MSSGQAPCAWEFCEDSEGRKPEGLRHVDEEVEGRPWQMERPLDGAGRVAFKPQVYCLRPKGFLPEERPYF